MYQCLRDCWVTERLFRKGEVYNLPDETPKSEKNFRLVGEPVIAEVAPEVTMGVTPDTEPVNELSCSVCGQVCKSKFGLNSHMKKHARK